MQTITLNKSAYRVVGSTASWALLLLCMLLLTACGAHSQVKTSGYSDHISASGFTNSDGSQQDKPFSDLLKWQWQRFKADLPKPPQQQLASAAIDAAAIRDNCNAGQCAKPQAVWLGHATVLLQAGGSNLLFDPIFSKRASPLGFLGPKRANPPALAPADLPYIDAVFISHNHYDHLDKSSVVTLSQQTGGSPRFFVPLGLAQWFRDAGIDNVVELDWWDKGHMSGADIHFVPAHHWSARGLFDRNQSLWGGWVATTSDGRFYFAGDTGWSDDFAAIGARFPGIDLAAIPIGAYAPRWFMGSQHVDPAQAVDIFQAVGAQRAFGMHWGTFELTDESLDQPPKDLAQALERANFDTQRFRVLKLGQTMALRND